MSMIIRSGDILKIGTDLVDAVSGTLKSQGKVTCRRHGCTDKDLTWVSTFECVKAEKLLRQAVKDERQTITYFESQAI